MKTSPFTTPTTTVLRVTRNLAFSSECLYQPRTFSYCLNKYSNLVIGRPYQVAVRRAFGPSMTVPRHAHRLRDALVFHCRREHHAVGELLDHAALDLLPR